MTPEGIYSIIYPQAHDLRRYEDHMKNLKAVKTIIMAAGFIISAAFYVHKGEGREVLSELPEKTLETEAASLGDIAETGVELSELHRLSDAQREEVKALIANAMDELRSELSTGAAPAGTEPADPAGPAESEMTAASEAGPTAKETVAASQQGGKININTAGKEELMELTGIGEARALAIIEYRETYGGFGYIEEIMNISGIKEAAFSKIKDRICV